MSDVPPVAGERTWTLGPMGDLDREGLEAAMEAWVAAETVTPDAAPPGDERFAQKMSAALRAYLSASRSPRDLEAVVEEAAKALAVDYRWKWDALKERESHAGIGDRYTLRRSARAVLEAALPFLVGPEPEGLTEQECTALLNETVVVKGRELSPELSSAFQKIDALGTRLARLRGEEGETASG